MFRLPRTAVEVGYWECDLGSGSWVPYEWPISALVEVAFCSRLPNVDFTARGMAYQVVFSRPETDLDQSRPVRATQTNLRSGCRREVRRWPDKHQKAQQEERARADAQAMWGVWLSADWSWLLLDSDDATAIAGGQKPITAAPEKVPYSLGTSSVFDGVFWPELLRLWPAEDLVSAAHPFGRRCNFALRRVSPLEASTSEACAREWVQLQELWQRSGLSARRLVGAFRVQNRALLHGFAGAQQAMRSCLGLLGREQSLEVRLLWHGTRTPASLIDICSDGFDRAQAQTCVYGKGCYFATSAAYSDKYACTVRVPTESHGRRALLLAAVLVGELAQGAPNMYPPPVKPHSRTGERFENTCDKVSAPSIVVTYKDNQAIPCYVMIYDLA